LHCALYRRTAEQLIQQEYPADLVRGKDVCKAYAYKQRQGIAKRYCCATSNATLMHCAAARLRRPSPEQCRARPCRQPAWQRPHPPSWSTPGQQVSLRTKSCAGKYARCNTQVVSRDSTLQGTARQCVCCACSWISPAGLRGMRAVRQHAQLPTGARTGWRRTPCQRSPSRSPWPQRPCRQPARATAGQWRAGCCQCRLRVSRHRHRHIQC